jgi:hypothetical protein
MLKEKEEELSEIAAIYADQQRMMNQQQVIALGHHQGLQQQQYPQLQQQQQYPQYPQYPQQQQQRRQPAEESKSELDDNNSQQ